jgi:hypothetical protein
VKRENSLFVEQAVGPVHKKLIENGATSQLRILSGEKSIFPGAVGQPDAS